MTSTEQAGRTDGGTDGTRGRDGGSATAGPDATASRPPVDTPSRGLPWSVAGVRHGPRRARKPLMPRVELPSAPEPAGAKAADPVATTVMTLGGRRGTEVLLVGTATGAVLGLGLAYRLAALGSPLQFVAFWAPLLCFLAVVVAVLVDVRVDSVRRGFALVLVGFVMAAPKVIRSPGMPIYFDELAHWRQANHMVATGQVLQDNVVTILRDYPGLHALTTALERATGLSTWTLGTVLLVSLRVVVPVLAATVGRAAGLSPRAADLAGLVYALNPGFMFFTGMYAYESLAIVLQLAAVGLLGMVVAGSRPSAGAARRLSVLLTFAVALTHHLTSLMFLLMVFALLVLHRGRIARRDLRRRESRRRVARLGVTLIGVVLVVTSLHAGEVFGYLSAFPARAAEQLATLLEGGGATKGNAAVAADVAGSRIPLANAGVPMYEVFSGLASIPMLTLLGAVGAVLLWPLRRVPFTRLVVVVALAYPMTMPLILTVHGAPAAHRSWPFSWQGLAVLVGAALASLAGLRVRAPEAGPDAPAAAAQAAWRPAGPLHRARLRLFRLLDRLQAFLDRKAPRPRVRGLLVFVVLAVVTVGTGAVENNTTTRLPGPYVLGAEGRVQTPELLALSRWTADERRRGVDLGRVGGDYYSMGYVSFVGGLPPVAAYPVWDLFFYDAPVKRESLAALGSAGPGLLVIDRRVTTGLPATGAYIDASEPPMTAPIPDAALRRLERDPWAVKVWSGTNYDVYRILPDRALDPTGATQ